MGIPTPPFLQTAMLSPRRAGKAEDTAPRLVLEGGFQRLYSGRCFQETSVKKTNSSIMVKGYRHGN